MKRTSLIMALALWGYLSLPVTAQVGKKGEVKPAPVTPAPKKTTPPKKSPPARRTGGSTTPARTTAPMGNDPAANERTFWESIRNSNDAEDFREYLRQYPQGQFAGLARNRLRQLEAKPAGTSGASSVAAPTSTSRTAGAIVRNQMGMELVFVPAGSFMMGSENGGSDGVPVHQVTIREGFYMGRYEVTQAQWQTVMGNNPSSFKDCGGNCPVEQVSWDHAQNFINKLNASNDGFRYRLPTEAEWEYACRAGTTGDYAGNLSEMAWYRENSGSKAHIVGEKRPNAWGLADMHGNVWEWCQDWYHGTYYGAPTDGSAWLNGGEQKYRVLRGGSWVSYAPNLRSALRNFDGSPAFRNDIIGFRLVAVARTR